jgi:hypothetical protein
MAAVRSNYTNKAHFIVNWNMVLGTFVQKKHFDPENRQRPATPCRPARKSGLPPLVCDDRPA